MGGGMQKTLVILMGIQASGKSTFYKTFLANDFVRVNLDTLKTRFQEKLLLEDCFEKGLRFAVDNTNPTKLDRQRYIPRAKEEGYKIVGYFLESKIQPCVQRNGLREGKACVPERAIYATANKFERPSYSEGFNELYYVKNDGVTFTVTKWQDYE